VVIPVHDRNPVRRPPVVTWALIALNVVVFLVSPVVSAPLLDDGSDARVCRQEAFFRRWGAVPHELVTNSRPDVVPIRPAEGGCLVGPPPYTKVPFLSALTSMFLHAGWLHLLGNMLFLFVFGNNVEDRLGRLRYLAFYLGWGVVATYGFALVNAGSHAVVVGASGAIAGVLGAYLVLFPRARVISLLPFLFFLPVPLPAWLVLGSWFVLQWVYATGAGVAAGSGVAFLAHLVGFVAGALTARRYRKRAALRRRSPWWSCRTCRGRSGGGGCWSARRSATTPCTSGTTWCTARCRMRTRCSTRSGCCRRRPPSPNASASARSSRRRRCGTRTCSPSRR
jgi:membrane associated rhomboid family serine protease